MGARSQVALVIVPTPVGVNRVPSLFPDMVTGIVPTPVGVNRFGPGRCCCVAALSPHPWG